MCEVVSEALKVTGIVTVVNPQGIHARPAAKIVQCALPFDSEIYLAREDEPTIYANAKSLMGLLTLTATRGTRLVVTAEGLDAHAAVAAQQTLFESGFGEL